MLFLSYFLLFFLLQSFLSFPSLSVCQQSVCVSLVPKQLILLPLFCLSGLFGFYIQPGNDDAIVERLSRLSAERWCSRSFSTIPSHHIIISIIIIRLSRIPEQTRWCSRSISTIPSHHIIICIMWSTSSKRMLISRVNNVGGGRLRRLLSTMPERMYTPCGSYWIQHSSNEAKMGITTRFFEQEIPDSEIDKMTLHPWCVGGGVSLHWSGLKITDGDEVRHHTTIPCHLPLSSHTLLSMTYIPPVISHCLDKH